MITNRRAFETLHGFNDSVTSCRVVANRNVLLLEQGLKTATRMVEATRERRAKVILIGNGGSAAIASHQAVDLWKNGGIRAQAFNDSSLLTCVGNDYGYEYVFEKPIRMFADPQDLLVAVSSSGKSLNILNGVAAAKEMGMSVITFSGFDADNPLSSLGDLNFYISSSRYGTVEIAHLLLIHAIIDEVIELSRAKKPSPVERESIGEHTLNEPTN